MEIEIPPGPKKDLLNGAGFHELIRLWMGGNWFDSSLAANNH
jgi:hypothetical protein